ncbi:DPY30 domain containing 2 isoform X4 [Electrophorus electricus]|uniref:DPY30 domain containing 1 n=1 Tax=Electrophorus electricus TaxID=8005 RepID=A0A4W4GBZ3_ELEEL|nr:DPY30 domain containing 2 isoform X4 [Electrophorus electricus]
MDSAYLQQKLGRCLVEGLAATVERRPPDPVEFLALWIYKHRENLEHAEKRAVYEKQLAEALESAREEALHQRLLRDEEDRVRAAQEPREEAVSTPPPTPLKERPQKLNTPVLEAVLEEEDSAGPAVAEDTAGLERSADMERSPPIAGTGEVQKPDDLERRPTEKGAADDPAPRPDGSTASSAAPSPQPGRPEQDENGPDQAAFESDAPRPHDTPSETDTARLTDAPPLSPRKHTEEDEEREGGHP